MRKTFAGIGSLLLFFIAPGIVAGLAPWWIAGEQISTPFLDTNATRLFGIILVIAGLVPLVESFVRFAINGLGTPAPIFPTRNLVVSGFYRFMRNPMYVGVLAIVVGDGLILGSMAVFAYALLVWLGFALFVILYEEPTLRRTFGASYDEFYSEVPRWVPRVTPWQGRQK